MRNKRKGIFIPLMTLFLIFTIGFSALAAPITFSLSREIGEFRYRGDTYGVKRITMDGTGDIAYCLEINNDYPNDDHFTKDGTVNELLSCLMDNSFPQKTASELGVDNDNEAYLATQIVLWSIVEGFNVNLITTPNKNTQRAIVKIYNKVTSIGTSQTKYPVYSPGNKEIQDIVVSKPIESPNIPKPEEEKPGPKPEEEKPGPKPEEEKPSPKPEEEKPSPKPEEEKPGPKPEEEKPGPKPVEKKPTPKSVEEKPTPKPETAPQKAKELG
ncbi:MAG: Cys-Gln thioester bond-forming surface protein [Clostridium sp.]